MNWGVYSNLGSLNEIWSKKIKCRHVPFYFNSFFLSQVFGCLEIINVLSVLSFNSKYWNEKIYACFRVGMSLWFDFKITFSAPVEMNFVYCNYVYSTLDVLSFIFKLTHPSPLSVRVKDNSIKSDQFFYFLL